MSNNAESLKLEYAFTPDPGPTIYASADSTQPNQLSLGITISTRTSFPLTLKHIQVKIPVGHDDSPDLAPAAALPEPIFDTQANPTLSVSVNGSLVTIATNNQTDLTISSARPLIFTLPAIAVGTHSGVVPLTITESPTSGPDREDKTTYSLTKQQTTWPVTRFWAEPATLSDLDQTVTLKWSCNSLGTHYSYSLSAPGWQPRDCLNSGNCYDVQDGVAGITTQALADTTEFTLAVVQAEAGNRSTVGILKTTVPILQPKIKGKSPAVYFSGWVARLYWLATNASRCTVSLNGVTRDDHAPLDTWDKGYLVQASGEGEQKFEVTATAASGQVDVFTVPSFVTSKAQRVVALPYDPYWPSAWAVSPDGTLGLVNNSPDAYANYSVSVIDVAKRTISPPNTIRVPYVFTLAISPDRKLALSSTGTGYYGFDAGYVSVVDLAKGTVKPGTIAVGKGPSAIAFTPDSKLAVVANSADTFVSVIDTSTLDPHPPAIPCDDVPMAIAFTPDSRVALVGSLMKSTLTVIDLGPPPSARPSRIPTGGEPYAIAVTSDGKLALVARKDSSELLVIDVPTLTVRSSTIPAGNAPISITITPDGQMALVGNSGDNSLTVIDLSALRPIGPAIPLGADPRVMAITGDGKSAVIVDKSGVMVL